MSTVTINELRASVAAPAMTHQFNVTVFSEVEEDVQRYQALLLNLVSVNVAKIPTKNNFGLMVPTLVTMRVQMDEEGTVLVALMSLLHTTESVDVEVTYFDAKGNPTSTLELTDCELSDITLPTLDFTLTKPMFATITFYVTTVAARLA